MAGYQPLFAYATKNRDGILVIMHGSFDKINYSPRNQIPVSTDKSLICGISLLS